MSKLLTREQLAAIRNSNWTTSGDCWNRPMESLLDHIDELERLARTVTDPFVDALTYHRAKTALRAAVGEPTENRNEKDSR